MANSSLQKSKRFFPNWYYMDENNQLNPGEINRSSYNTLPSALRSIISETCPRVGYLYADAHLKEFTKFPALPPELRLMIWNYQIEPRIVEILYSHESQSCYSRSPVPILLHINVETRKFALEHYKLMFGIDGGEPEMYFNLKRDTFYFGTGNISEDSAFNCLRGISSAEKNSIQHLAMDSHLRLHHEFFESRMWKFHRGLFDGFYEELKTGFGEGDERGFTEKEDTLIRQMMFGDHILMDFCGLKSMTIVDIEDQGDHDLNVAEVDEKPGEYQAWRVGPKGQAEKLQTHQSPRIYTYREEEVTEAWNELELLAWVSPDAPRFLVRRVTLDRLAHRPEWETRSNELRHTFYLRSHKGLYPRSVGKGIYYFFNQLEKAHPTTNSYLLDEMARVVGPRPYHIVHWWRLDELLLAKYGRGYDDGLEQDCSCQYSHPGDCHLEDARIHLRQYEYAGVTDIVEQMADHFTRITTTLEGQRRLADIISYSGSHGQTQLSMLQAIAVALVSLLPEGRKDVWQIAQEIRRPRRPWI